MVSIVKEVQKNLAVSMMVFIVGVGFQVSRLVQIKHSIQLEV